MVESRNTENGNRTLECSYINFIFLKKGRCINLPELNTYQLETLCFKILKQKLKQKKTHLALLSQQRLKCQY